MSTLKDKILAELDVDKAMKHISWLTETTPRRISGTGQDRIAAEYIVSEMKSYGCEAEILEFETYNSRPGTSRSNPTISRAKNSRQHALLPY